MLRGSAARFLRLDAMAMNNLFYTLNILKVAELKVLCTHLKLAKSGAKRALIDRLIEAVRRNPHFQATIITYVTKRELVQPSVPKTTPTVPAANTYATPRNVIMRRPETFPAQPQMTAVSEDALKVARGFLENYLEYDLFADHIDIILPVAVFKMPLLTLTFDLTDKQMALIRHGMICRLSCIELTNRMNKDELENCWPTNATLIVNASPIPLQQRVYQDGKAKNKAMRDRPAEIQAYIRTGRNYFKLTGQPNMEQGDWPYGICITIARRRTMNEVVEIIKSKNTIPVEDSVNRIKEMYSEENDIVTEKMSVSVRCPLTWQRLEVPARGRQCTHLSCFGLQDFLKFHHESKNQSWRCITCHSGPLNLNTIVVDSWFQNVLNKVSHIENLDHVDVLPDGTVTFEEKVEGSTKETQIRNEESGTDQNASKTRNDKSSSDQNPLKKQRVDVADKLEAPEENFRREAYLSYPVHENRPRSFTSASDDLAGVDYVSKGNSIDNAIEL